jgi:hypothetical protein
MSEEDRFFVCDMDTSEEGTLLDGFGVGEQWVGPLKTGSLLTVGPLRIRIELSDMAKDAPLSSGAAPGGQRAHVGSDSSDGEYRPASGSRDPHHWKSKVYQKTIDDKVRQPAEYKDRAGERRKRHSEEGAALDALVNKFGRIQEAERLAAEAEEARVEEPTREAHREVNMNIDGSFVGFGGMERAGIGFASSMGGAELIPNVPNPKALSQQEAARLKTQMRFKEAS